MHSSEKLCHFNDNLVREKRPFCPLNSKCPQNRRANPPFLIEILGRFSFRPIPLHSLYSNMVRPSLLRSDGDNEDDINLISTRRERGEAMRKDLVNATKRSLASAGSGMKTCGVKYRSI